MKAGFHYLWNPAFSLVYPTPRPAPQPSSLSRAPKRGLCAPAYLLAQVVGHSPRSRTSRAGLGNVGVTLES